MLAEWRMEMRKPVVSVLALEELEEEVRTSLIRRRWDGAKYVRTVIKMVVTVTARKKEEGKGEGERNNEIEDED